MNILSTLESGWESMILVMLFLAFGVPLLLIVIGVTLRNKNKKASKILLISAVVYVLIGLGICGTLMM